MEVGFRVIDKMKEILGDDADIEKDAAKEGNTITMILFRNKNKK